MSHPHALTSLDDREAITDALYRAILAFDHNDHALLDTAFIPEHDKVTFQMGEHKFEGMASIKSQLLDFVGPMDTTHMISNIRVDVKDGAKEAQLNCYALAQHCLEGEGMNPGGKKYLAASEYWVDFVKGDAGWVIEKWLMKTIWTQGDASVMKRPS